MPNCWVNYWVTGASPWLTEAMQDEEIKILTHLFLITESLTRSLILYQPLDSSWTGGSSFRGRAYSVPSLLAENESHLSYCLPPLCLPCFSFSLQWTESQVLASYSGSLRPADSSSKHEESLKGTLLSSITFWILKLWRVLFLGKQRKSSQGACPLHLNGVGS